MINDRLLSDRYQSVVLEGLMSNLIEHFKVFCEYILRHNVVILEVMKSEYLRGRRQIQQRYSFAIFIDDEYHSWIGLREGY